MCLLPTMLQDWDLFELLLNPHFAPELEHLVINDRRNLDKSLLESFMKMDIQPSTGGNTIKRRELIKDVIVINCDRSELPVICGQDDNKVSNFARFSYTICATKQVCRTIIVNSSTSFRIRSSGSSSRTDLSIHYQPSRPTTIRFFFV